MRERTRYRTGSLGGRCSLMFALLNFMLVADGDSPERKAVIAHFPRTERRRREIGQDGVKAQSQDIGFIQLRLYMPCVSCAKYSQSSSCGIASACMVGPRGVLQLVSEPDLQPPAGI
ncbi:hypothetical protein FB567DRAFT_158807 [Paraphoma chrysanthemicola]|uniref:Secreted protein n=1 Tax=Paraphoma chrysanthemicola TaxID=798071 RepID=A0A8K0RH82_9PLEO|nr:hypothetical protein FB567DRAFT_158807 [Paraphoma chrysanthemicola]